MVFRNCHVTDSPQHAMLGVKTSSLTNNTSFPMLVCIFILYNSNQTFMCMYDLIGILRMMNFNLRALFISTFVLTKKIGAAKCMKY